MYDHKISLIPYVQVGNDVLLKGKSSSGSTSPRLFVDNPLQVVGERQAFHHIFDSYAPHQHVAEIGINVGLRHVAY